MKHLLGILLLCGGAIAAFAQNTTFTYQGRVQVSGTDFSGAGQFKFALVAGTNISRQATATANLSGQFVVGYNVTFGGNGYVTPPAVTVSGGGGSGATAHATISGGMVTSVQPDSAGSGYTSPPTVTIAPPPPNISFTTFWSNDNTSVAGSEPSAAVSVPVSNGLFTVVLGDTTLANMAAIDASVFLNQKLQLRIWFSDDVNPFAALDPPQDLTPTPYALFAQTAGTVINNSVTAASIASGQVVKSLNGLKDAVNLVASTNVTLRTNGNNLSLSAGPWLLNGSSTFYNGGNVGIGTTTPNAPLHIASDANSVMTLQDTGPNSTQSGYVSFRNGNLTETAWVGFGTPGDPDFSVVNARSGGDIVLLPFFGNVGIGTATPQARLDVRGDIRLGSSGQLRAASGEENLRIIRGSIERTGAILHGSGFTVARLEEAKYQITFNTPFAGIPSVTATTDRLAETPSMGIYKDGITTSSVILVTFRINTGDFRDWSFDFIAVGPR
jgi:hypothetical protein